MSTPNAISDPSHAGFSLADFRAGAVVSLVALPLCLGTAVASGFPPIAGVVTAILGGLVVSPLGSARLTIKGPAVGLIVVTLGAVTELGTSANGQLDPSLGYHRTLAVGCVAACVQILFALLRTATSASLFRHRSCTACWPRSA